MKERVFLRRFESLSEILHGVRAWRQDCAAWHRYQPTLANEKREECCKQRCPVQSDRKTTTVPERKTTARAHQACEARAAVQKFPRTRTAPLQCGEQALKW